MPPARRAWARRGPDGRRRGMVQVAGLEAWTQVAPLAVAPFVGSFLSVLAHRLPAGRDWVRGRSACPACGGTLRARDMVPVLSWVLLRGRCRACRAAISPLYPALELGALGIALWAVAAVPPAVVWWACVLGWGLLVLSAIDLAVWRLPNVLTYPLGAAGLVFAAVMVPGQLGDHALGWLLGLGVVVALNLAWRALRGQDGLGWGDAKLLAAGGAWAGWAGLGGILFIAAVAALAFVLILRLRGRTVTADMALPFGPALALGIWLTLLHGPLLIG